MNHHYDVRQSIVINASPARVWDALVNPAVIRRYMFDANVVSDWKTGSPILFKGEWQGKPYQDKGVITRIEPQRVLQYTHYSPLSGLSDTPDNYHTVTLELTAEGTGTRLSLVQDNNATAEAQVHSEEGWRMMLGTLKKVVEE